MIENKIFMDQIDGYKYAKDWILDIYNQNKNKFASLDYQEHNLALQQNIVDGNVLSLWNGERIMAQATIIRTPMNKTQVILNLCEN